MKKALYSVLLLFFVFMCFSCKKQISKSENEERNPMPETTAISSFQDSEGSKYSLSNEFLLVQKNIEHTMDEFIDEITDNNYALAKTETIQQDNYLISMPSSKINSLDPVKFSTIDKAYRVYENTDKKVTINQLIAKASKKYDKGTILAVIDEHVGIVSERSLPERSMYFISTPGHNQDILQLKKNLENSGYFEYVEFDLVYFSHEN